MDVGDEFFFFWGASSRHLSEPDRPRPNTLPPISPHIVLRPAYVCVHTYLELSRRVLTLRAVEALQESQQFPHEVVDAGLLGVFRERLDQLGRRCAHLRKSGHKKKDENENKNVNAIRKKKKGNAMYL